MPLDLPSTEDLQKIHNEINQLVNQRFVVTTVAISLSGGIAAWVLQMASVPQCVPSQAESCSASTSMAVGVLLYALSCLQGVSLLALFLFQNSLKRMLRVLSTYLVVTARSGWERDWAKYRDHESYSPYSGPIASVFLALALAGALFPELVVKGFSLKRDQLLGSHIHWAIYSVVVSVVLWLGFSGGAASEARSRRLWEEIKDSAPRRRQLVRRRPGR